MAIKIYSKGKSTKVSKNFKTYEFDCHGKGCCATTQIDEKLVEYLQQIRDHFGKPVTLSSAYRCDIHNKSVKGATASRHKTGMAADIIVKGVKPAEVAKYCESIGILGIGLYETDADGHFVHIDTRTTKSFWYGQAQKKRDTFQDKPVQTEKPVQEQPKNQQFAPYNVRVTASSLNYRSGPGTKYKINGTVKKNEIYGIVEEQNGNWGKLKSGAGWICLDYVKKI